MFSKIRERKVHIKTRQQTDIPCSWIRRLNNIDNMTIPPNWSADSMYSLPKCQRLFAEIDKMVIKFV